MRFVPAPPSIVKTFAPFPLMVNVPLLLMIISFVNVMVVTVLAKLIVSFVGEVFAASIAPLNVQSTPETHIGVRIRVVAPRNG